MSQNSKKQAKALKQEIEKEIKELDYKIDQFSFCQGEATRQIVGRCQIKLIYYQTLIKQLDEILEW